MHSLLQLYNAINVYIVAYSCTTTVSIPVVVLAVVLACSTNLHVPRSTIFTGIPLRTTKQAILHGKSIEPQES